MKAFARFAWFVLIYNLAVILWGAWVRISFSGDGCGAHWPLCNGEIVPQQMQLPRLVEFAHRATSGIDTVLILLLCAWAFYRFPAGHAVRRFAVLSVVFVFTEGLLGAALVLLRQVAHDQSAGRVWSMSAHLTNTLILLACVTTTAWAASTGVEQIRLPSASALTWIALGLTVMVGITGAIAALGDTLYPSRSLASGLSQDFAAGAHMAVRLRILHPILALGTAVYLVVFAMKHMQKAAQFTIAVVVAQVAAGMVNLRLLAPGWMQLVHLFIADVLWIALVILCLQTLLKQGRQLS